MIKKQKIKSIITKLIKEKRSFTIYDIVKILRRKGYEIYYNDIKDDIHSLVNIDIQKSNYTKSFISVANKDNSFTTYLFHHKTVDPSEYLCHDFYDNEKFTNKSEKFTIPKKLIDQSNFKYSKKVYFIKF